VTSLGHLEAAFAAAPLAGATLVAADAGAACWRVGAAEPPEFVVVVIPGPGAWPDRLHAAIARLCARSGLVWPTIAVVWACPLVDGGLPDDLPHQMTGVAVTLSWQAALAPDPAGMPPYIRYLLLALPRWLAWQPHKQVLSAPPEPQQTLHLPPAHQRATLWLAAWWTLVTALAYHWHVPALPPQQLRMGCSEATRTLGGEPWRLLSAVALTDGAAHLALIVFGLLVAQPLEAAWGSGRWLLVMLGTSLLGHAAALALPTQLSSGPVAGLVALLLALWLQLRRGAVPMPPRAALAMRRAAATVLWLHVPALALPSVALPAVLVGLAVGAVLGRMDLAIARPRWAWAAAVVLVGAVAASVGQAVMTLTPQRLLPPPPRLQTVVAGDFVLEVPLLADQTPVTKQDSSLLIVGNSQLDGWLVRVSESAVPATAATAQTHLQRFPTVLVAERIVADCAGQPWRLQVSALLGMPDSWQALVQPVAASWQLRCVGTK
jgi:hypothetical protein